MSGDHNMNQKRIKNKDDIIRMAREADLWLTSDERIAAVERFATLVAAAEREACAKVCEQEALRWPPSRDFTLCAAAIRARGQS